MGSTVLLLAGLWIVGAPLPLGEPGHFPEMPYTVARGPMEATTAPHPVNCRCTPNHCHNESGRCFSRSGTCFTQLAEDDNRELVAIEQGCINPTRIFTAYIRDICPDDPLLICCQGELCNEQYLNSTVYPPTEESTTAPVLPTEEGVPETEDTALNTRGDNRWRGGGSNTPTYPLYLVGGVVFLVAITMGTMLLTRFCKARSYDKNKPSPPVPNPTFTTPGWQPVPGHEITSSCSSGSGNTRLTERTLIREISFVERIGKGRYGAVWRGNWRAGGQVAVKVFCSREEASWWHEAEMYQNYWLRHDNILSYIGADQRDCVTSMEYYLVLSYHPQGSLFDYLQTSTLTKEECVLLCLSLSAGLDYLHTEIRSSVAKPAIAHRDLKTKNILIKSTEHGSVCCIADFGLAARSDFFERLPDKESFHYRVGTRRYMAPEILSSSINLSTFECMKRCDMYMLALCVWEVGRRVGPGALPYEYPYQHEVPSDPTIQEMEGVVVRTHTRPSLRGTLPQLSRLIEECWTGDPASRLTSLRVRKDLIAVMEGLQTTRDSVCYLTDTSDQGFQSWD